MSMGVKRMSPSFGDWEVTFTNNMPHFAVGVCPHCDIATTMPVKAAAMSRFEDGYFSYHVVVQCSVPKCGELTYLMFRPHPNPNTDEVKVLELVPSGKIKEPHQAIPKAVAADWIEAQKALSVGAIKAAAVMCRRVLYGVLLDKKCKEHPLHQGIEELIQKENMPPIVREWLNEIKDDGHDAAHPYRALDVPAENVAETLEYTRELLRFVYIEPHDLAARLARKAAKTTP